MLSALDANGTGRLISVDIDGAAGGSARGHPRWSFRVHSPGRSWLRQLRELLAEEGPVDFFFHDASHTYYDQYSEYRAAWEGMRGDTLFVSDDVDWSSAFVDLTATVGAKPVFLTDRRKVAEALRHP
jgi:predicted O-methyltransferase YrrM